MAFVIQNRLIIPPHPPPTVVATAIEKDQEDVCSSESTVEKSQQYITAAMDKEEQTQTILLSICSFTFSEHKPKHQLVLNFRYRCPNLLRSFTDLEFSLPEAPITK